MTIVTAAEEWQNYCSLMDIEHLLNICGQSVVNKDDVARSCRAEKWAVSTLKMSLMLQ